MKKLFLFVLSLSLITACSSDDDVSTPEADPIVGTWVVVGASLFDPADCENESTITFTPDNDANGTFYFEQTGCEAETSSGSWENIGNSSYTVSVPVLGELQGTADFTSEDRFVFSTGAFGSFTFERQ